MQRHALQRLHGCRRALAAAAFALCIPHAVAHEHAAPAAPATVAAAPEGQLEFFDRKASPADIAGWYANAGALVEFRVESSNGDARSAFGTTPDKVVARLTVNGAPVDHTFDYAARTVAIDGHDMTLEADDIAVLRAFYPKIEQALYATAMAQRRGGEAVVLPRAQDALHRLATMYSEAPLGKVLGRRTVLPPKVSYAAQEKPRSIVPGHDLPSAQLAGEACQANGQNGLTYLYEPCNTSRNRDSYHDADHCYWATYDAYGEKAPSCQGRCGAGCGLFGGWGTWSVDCHDHDMCETYHDANCGDEWDEAADDYLDGWPVC